MRFLICLMTYLVGSWAHAAAWLQEEGSVSVIVTLEEYHSHQLFDEDAEVVDNEFSLQFSLQPYVEYGLTQDTTIGMVPRFVYGDVAGAVGRQRRIPTVNDLSVFARFDLLQSTDVFVRKKIYQNKDWMVSIQPQITLPSLFYDGTEWDMAAKSHMVELRILVGRNLSPSFFSPSGNLSAYAGQDHFINTELAYRQKARTHANVRNEWRWDTTLGFRPHGERLVLVQHFGMMEASHAPSLPKRGLSKVQLSVVEKFSDRISLQFGMFGDIWGRSTNKGTGVMMGVWYQF